MGIQDDEIIGFEPDGDGYDYQNALDAGYKADETGHWASIDNRTGMVLKGRNHPTWNKTVEAETALGNTIIKGENGRYYSVKIPQYMSDPIIEDNPFEDTPLDVAERAKRDFGFAIDKNITLGGLSALKREWATASGLIKKIPITGAAYTAGENINLMNAVRRLQNNQIYLKELAIESGGQDANDLSAVYGIDKNAYIEKRKEKDQKLVSDFLEYLAADKTYMHKLVSGASQLPTFIFEFIATGGLAATGKAAATASAKKLVSSYAETAAGKIALKAAGFSGSAILRGTAGFGHRTLEKMSSRQLESVLGLREEEGWATSALTAWGDTVVEIASEMSGEGLTTAGGFILKKLPFGKKLTTALETAWLSATGGEKGEFARKMLSKGGYSNILGEIGEERLGTILRAITDVDDFGAGKDATMIERLQSGILQDIENIGVEVGVLSIPAGGQVILGQFAKEPKADFDSTQFDQTPIAETKPQEQQIVEKSVESATMPAMAEDKAARDNIEPSKQQPSGKDGKQAKSFDEWMRDFTAKTPQRSSKSEAAYFDGAGEIQLRYATHEAVYDSSADAFNVALKGKGDQDADIVLSDENITKEEFKEVLKKWFEKSKKEYEDNYDEPFTYATFEEWLKSEHNRQRNILGQYEADRKFPFTETSQSFNAPAPQDTAEAGKGVKEAKQEPVKPVTIESANTAKDINQVVEQIVTQGIGTSARQADLNETRAALGLDGIASAERKSWQMSLQQAKDRNIINEALRIAGEVNAKPRPLNDVETAGLVMKAAQLKNEHQGLIKQMEFAKEKTDIDDLSTRIDIVEKEFDTLTNALYASGTEKGRALASQKLTINQDFDLLTLKNRAKKIKGRELTEKEVEKITQLSKDLELQHTINAELQRRIDELIVKKTIKQGSIRRYSRMSRTEIDTELNSLISRTKQLLEEGCMN